MSSGWVPCVGPDRYTNVARNCGTMCGGLGIQALTKDTLMSALPKGDAEAPPSLVMSASAGNLLLVEQLRSLKAPRRRAQIHESRPPHAPTSKSP